MLPENILEQRNKEIKQRSLLVFVLKFDAPLRSDFFSEINIHKRKDSQSLCWLFAIWQMCAYEASQRWESQWNSSITTHQRQAAACFPQPNITRTWGHKKETSKRLLKVHLFQATWKMEHKDFTQNTGVARQYSGSIFVQKWCKMKKALDS